MPQILYEIIKKVKKYRIHILCWFLFIFYELAVVITLIDDTSSFLAYLIFYSLNISLFYFHSDFVFPKAVKKSESIYWRLPLLVIAELSFFVTLTFGANVFLNDVLHVNQNEDVTYDALFLMNLAWRGFYFILYSTAYFYIKRYIAKQKAEINHIAEVEALKNQLLRSEIDFLRAQINPHLLFNTLSFIKYSAKHSPDEAEKAMVLLKDILSFATQSGNSEKVSIENEVKQVENLIQLNQLRFGHNLYVDFVKNIEVGNRSIMPIVLLTLVENVFKHGNLHDKKKPAEIYVESAGNWVVYKTKNLIGNPSLVESTNTGLKNIASRLEKSLPQKHSFDFGVENNIFTVEVRMQLD